MPSERLLPDVSIQNKQEKWLEDFLRMLIPGDQKTGILVGQNKLITIIIRKVLFTDRYTWQNIHPRFLVLVNNCVEYQKSRTKVLPCVNSR